MKNKPSEKTILNASSAEITNSESSRLSVGDKIQTKNAAWSFAGQTAENFDDHVLKSVPLYEKGHDLICKLTDYFVRADSVVYEIGTSTGALLEKLINHNKSKQVKWIGLDCEDDMIKKARHRLGKLNNVELETCDINYYDFEKSDLIVSYYCIQFIHSKFRQELINKIYSSLNWGGAFIIFEKVRGPDARFQDIFTTLYNDFKLDQGYSCSEIIAKTKSLKGILEPFSSQANIDMMTRAGFKDVTSIMKYINFEGFLCIK